MRRSFYEKIKMYGQLTPESTDIYSEISAIYYVVL